MHWNRTNTQWGLILRLLPRQHAHCEGSRVRPQFVALEHYSFLQERMRLLLSALGQAYAGTDPFVVYSAYVDGCLSRLSTTAVLNVASGGSVVPTYIVIKR